MPSAARVNARKTRVNACPVDLSRLVRYEAIDNGQWYRVGPGDKRAGNIGQVVGILALKHAQGYEVVLRLLSGEVDTFSPLQLFPASDREIAASGRCHQLQLVL
ncbi:hypothetical protein [Acidovorax sp. sic0104]|uniref:hypothetical protein n=1 Tax=Acidovorax sp. sic0104 TaxID=2854784 RepID=UPI001C47B9DA|nr:hypothetical protein [Acidovorax sp. sic0104]MBV7542167.1 hypothetical protein [Acidovorax sp. sic0104]